MAAPAPVRGVQEEVHPTVPQCLLQLRDQADAYTELDGEGIQLWLDYELEALQRYDCAANLLLARLG
jgi:hypothetical protein